jgi:hypothetical protein
MYRLPPKTNKSAKPYQYSRKVEVATFIRCTATEEQVCGYVCAAAPALNAAALQRYWPNCIVGTATVLAACTQHKQSRSGHPMHCCSSSCSAGLRVLSICIYPAACRRPLHVPQVTPKTSNMCSRYAVSGGQKAIEEDGSARPLHTKPNVFHWARDNVTA